MNLAPGQVCAACVPYLNGNAWILTRIEKRLPSGDYIVCDEYDESQQNLRYTVPANHITEFPSSKSDYVAGEKILSLWYDEEGREWSTMFYEANVISDSSDGKVMIEFVGSTMAIKVDVSKLSRFPDDFDMRTEKQDDNNDEAAKPAPTDESRESEDSKKSSEEHNTVNDSTSHTKLRKKKDKIEKKKEVITKNENTEPEVSQVNMKRRIYFLNNNKTKNEKLEERTNMTDEDFSPLLPKNNYIRRLHSKEGTPLLDLLNDDDLFPQSSVHITVNGKLTVPNYCPKENYQCGLFQNDVSIGRLSRIIHQWRK